MVVASSRVVVGPFEAVVASVVANLKFYISPFLLQITRCIMGQVGCSVFRVFSLLANLAASASSTS